MEKLNSCSRRGQSLVEFALTIPVFLLLAVVIFDFGRAVYYYSAIQNAAREGVRYGAVNPLISGKNVSVDDAGMIEHARQYAIGLGLTSGNITAGMGNPEVVGDYPNPTVKVNIHYTFIPATPLVSHFLEGGVLNLYAEAVMRTEWLPRP